MFFIVIPISIIALVCWIYSTFVLIRGVNDSTIKILWFDIILGVFYSITVYLLFLLKWIYFGPTYVLAPFFLLPIVQIMIPTLLGVSLLKSNKSKLGLILLFSVIFTGIALVSFPSLMEIKNMTFIEVSY